MHVAIAILLYIINFITICIKIFSVHRVAFNNVPEKSNSVIIQSIYAPPTHQSQGQPHPSTKFNSVHITHITADKGGVHIPLTWSGENINVPITCRCASNRMLIEIGVA